MSNDTPLLALLDAFIRGVGHWHGLGRLTEAQRDELLWRAELIRADIVLT